MTHFTRIHTPRDPADDVLARVRSARIRRMADEAVEIQRRTMKVIDRLCPPPLLGWQSSRYPELNVTPTAERFEARANARRERERLFREIKPRIAAKVRKRSDDYLQFLAKGQHTFERQERRAAHRRGEA
jgi:hypothetical protein